MQAQYLLTDGILQRGDAAIFDQYDMRVSRATVRIDTGPARGVETTYPCLSAVTGKEKTSRCSHRHQAHIYLLVFDTNITNRSALSIAKFAPDTVAFEHRLLPQVQAA